MMNSNIIFKPEKTHLLCHIGDDCYKLEQFNTNQRQEWITRLFFDEICFEWDLDLIMNSIINENVVHKLHIPLNDAIDILIKHKVADEKKHAELMIEFLIQNKIYAIENGQLIFFNDMTISSISYLHCMASYLDSMKYKLMQLKSSVKHIEDEVISNYDIGIKQSEFKNTTEECITFFNNAFENGLNAHEISELIDRFKSFLDLNKLIHFNESDLNIIKNNKYQFNDMDEKIDFAIASIKETKQYINLVRKCVMPEFKQALKMIEMEPTINLSV